MLSAKNQLEPWLPDYLEEDSGWALNTHIWSNLVPAKARRQHVLSLALFAIFCALMAGALSTYIKTFNDREILGVFAFGAMSVFHAVHAWRGWIKYHAMLRSAESKDTKTDQ